MTDQHVLFSTVVRRGVKRKWTTDENEWFIKFFTAEIEKKKMAPGWKLLKAQAHLKPRTVAQIRTRVHNVINMKQKLNDS